MRGLSVTGILEGINCKFAFGLKSIGTFSAAPEISVQLANQKTCYFPIWLLDQFQHVRGVGPVVAHGVLELAPNVGHARDKADALAQFELLIGTVAVDLNPTAERCQGCFLSLDLQGDNFRSSNLFCSASETFVILGNVCELHMQ